MERFSLAGRVPVTPLPFPVSQCEIGTGCVRAREKEDAMPVLSAPSLWRQQAGAENTVVKPLADDLSVLH